LPSIGELTIMFTNFNLLTEKGAYFQGNYYWSSTWHDEFNAWMLNTYDGHVSFCPQNHENTVRPFFHFILADNFYNDQLNESYNFDLDNDIEDVSISDTIYPVK